MFGSEISFWSLTKKSYEEMSFLFLSCMDYPQDKDRFFLNFEDVSDEYQRFTFFHFICVGWGSKDSKIKTLKNRFLRHVDIKHLVHVPFLWSLRDRAVCCQGFWCGDRAARGRSCQG